MEHKHPPAPWAHRNGRIFAADRENLTIANVARSADGDYSPANARLIAAAPDLLAAAQEALKLLESVAPYHPQPAALRAAIAKATGSQT